MIIGTHCVHSNGAVIKQELIFRNFHFDSKEAAKESILYHYKHGFSGFAAVLTESQAQVIAGVIMLVNCEFCFPSMEKAGCEAFVFNLPSLKNCCRLPWNCPCSSQQISQPPNN